LSCLISTIGFILANKKLRSAPETKNKEVEFHKLANNIKNGEKNKNIFLKKHKGTKKIF